MSAKKGELRVGTSGYQYDHWRKVFYPEELPKREWFAHYAARFDTVEMNATFYGLPSPETFDSWRERAPDGFCFALKFSRFGTHQKRLLDPADTIPTFLERAERLRGFLGPILVQLPPHWQADPGRLDAFLAAAPRRHRWAVEFRDPSWLCGSVYGVLERHSAALCIHDKIADHPWRETAGWVYLRFHGEEGYRGNYSAQKLSASAKKVANLLGEGRDVYAYFNNDLGGHAPHNALDLRRYVLHRAGEEVAASGTGARDGA
jgi:uncharacterized protein YecE (DUF72 family)